LGGTPTPGVFGQRVRNQLKTKEMSFDLVQKSAQEYQNKGDRYLERAKLKERS